MGIAIGFLVPPILVPNVDDMNELAYHIRIMFYISAGVATLIFILVVIGKMIIHVHGLVERVGAVGGLSNAMQQPRSRPFQCHTTPTVTAVNFIKQRVIVTVCALQWCDNAVTSPHFSCPSQQRQ